MTPRQLNERLSKSTRAQDLLNLHAQHGHAFNSVNLATCWSGLGRVNAVDRYWLQSNDGARLVALRDQTTRQARSLEPRGVANTVHSLAKLAITATAWGSLWAELDGAALASVSDFNAQNLANTAWAFATAGRAAPALFDAISVEAACRVSDFNPQNLANTAWAFATAGRAAPVLFEALAAEAAQRVRDFSSQNLANTAWAFATAGRAAPALFDAIAAEATRRVRASSTQDMANTAWAFATAGRAAPVLFDALAAEVVRRVRELNPQEMANTAWAFATAGRAAPALFAAIAAEAAPRVREFKPRELANMAWDFATAGHAAPVLFDAIAAEAARRVRDFNSQDLANTVWAFATAGRAAPALFDAIAAEAARRVRKFTPQGLASTAWAFATVGRAAPALFDAIAVEAAKRLDELNPQNLANVAWALAAADASPTKSSLFDQRFARRCETLAHEFTIKELSQLHQWRLWYAGERGCSDALPGAALLARCAVAFRSSEVKISRLQSQVADTLASLGLLVQQELLLEEGYSVDLVVDCGGGQLIAVEVDGPTHFLGREPTGTTLLKRRQLQHLGWKLVSVPYWEWDVHVDEATRCRRRVGYLKSQLVFKG